MKKYKIGMYGGKFMPFHKGHMYCVEYAAAMCEKLYVILFHGGAQELEILKTRHEDWLQVESRESHMREALKDMPGVEFVSLDVTACKKEDGSQDWEAETPLVLEACGGHIDAVFGSEPDYDDYYSKAYPGAVYEMIDVDRTKYNISGTMCRAMDEEERAKWII